MPPIFPQLGSGTYEFCSTITLELCHAFYITYVQARLRLEDIWLIIGMLAYLK